MSAWLINGINGSTRIFQEVVDFVPQNESGKYKIRRSPPLKECISSLITQAGKRITTRNNGETEAFLVATVNLVRSRHGLTPITVLPTGVEQELVDTATAELSADASVMEYTEPTTAIVSTPATGGRTGGGQESVASTVLPLDMTTRCTVCGKQVSHEVAFEHHMGHYNGSISGRADPIPIRTPQPAMESGLWPEAAAQDQDQHSLALLFAPQATSQFPQRTHNEPPATQAIVPPLLPLPLPSTATAGQPVQSDAGALLRSVKRVLAAVSPSVYRNNPAMPSKMRQCGARGDAAFMSVWLQEENADALKHEVLSKKDARRMYSEFEEMVIE